MTGATTGITAPWHRAWRAALAVAVVLGLSVLPACGDDAPDEIPREPFPELEESDE